MKNPAVWERFLPPGAFISYTLHRFWKEGIGNIGSCCFLPFVSVCQCPVQAAGKSKLELTGRILQTARPMLWHCNWHTTLFQKGIMAVSASRSVHFIFAAFQYFSQFIKPKVFRQIAYACDQFSQLDIFMPPDHIICGVVYGMNIFCVYQSFVDIRVSRGACRSLFDIRVSREACCSLFDIRVSRGACRSLFDIRVSRGACRSLFDIRVSREACHSLFIHTGEMKSTRPGGAVRNLPFSMMRVCNLFRKAEPRPKCCLSECAVSAR